MRTRPNEPASDTMVSYNHDSLDDGTPRAHTSEWSTNGTPSECIFPMSPLNVRKGQHSRTASPESVSSQQACSEMRADMRTPARVSALEGGLAQLRSVVGQLQMQILQGNNAMLGSATDVQRELRAVGGRVDEVERRLDGVRGQSATPEVVQMDLQELEKMRTELEVRTADLVVKDTELLEKQNRFDAAMAKREAEVTRQDNSISTRNGELLERESKFNTDSQLALEKDADLQKGLEDLAKQKASVADWEARVIDQDNALRNRESLLTSQKALVQEKEDVLAKEKATHDANVADLEIQIARVATEKKALEQEECLVKLWNDGIRLEEKALKVREDKLSEDTSALEVKVVEIERTAESTRVEMASLREKLDTVMADNLAKIKEIETHQKEAKRLEVFHDAQSALLRNELQTTKKSLLAKVKAEGSSSSSPDNQKLRKLEKKIKSRKSEKDRLIERNRALASDFEEAYAQFGEPYDAGKDYFDPGF